MNDKKQTKKVTGPEIILDGQNMNEDIYQLVGYCVSLGWTHAIFPSSHVSELAAYFLKKWGKNVNEKK